MMSIFWSILVTSVSVWAAASMLPGIKVKTFWDAVVVSIVFGIVNFILGWFLFALIGVATIGIGFILHPLTTLVVSSLMLMLTDALTQKLEVKSFGWAFIGALVIAVLSEVLKRILHVIPGLPGI